MGTSWSNTGGEGETSDRLGSKASKNGIAMCQETDVEFEVGEWDEGGCTALCEEARSSSVRRQHSVLGGGL